MPAISRDRRSAFWLARVVHSRPRLFGSAAIGVVTTAALAALTAWRPVTQLLVGWDIGVTLYLILVLHLMTGAKAHHIRGDAQSQDEGRLTILVLTVTAALASLAAILTELASPAGSTAPRPPTQLVLATLTILLSWTLIHTIFTLHYAHEFYDETTMGDRGLLFPGSDKEPDYWDFVYFSFVIGMTSQVSDVGVTNKQMRRTVAIHGIVSFFFNAALLALTVNIAASAI
jgi:uncharacterized membrane protein